MSLKEYETRIAWIAVRQVENSTKAVYRSWCLEISKSEGNACATFANFKAWPTGHVWRERGHVVEDFEIGFDFGHLFQSLKTILRAGKIVVEHLAT